MAQESESHQPARDAALADRLKPALQSYFQSGWAFFVPYLLAYIVYARLQWPATPDFAGGGITDTGVSQHGSLVPPLLHVYWALHLLHLVVAAWALRSWWRSIETRAVSNPLPIRRCRVHEALRRHWVHWLHPVLPWLLLALVFYIPGVYLEWPSDPWEHLRRITEWQTHASVSGHSAGYKSFYFLAYSSVGWMPPRPLLTCINIYYTAICLCLAWQYFLLGRTVGLDRRWAIAFVAVGAVTFGNSSFSYYRYYGLATTIFSQIAAVALTRVFFSWVAPQPSSSSGTRPSLFAAHPRGIHLWSWLSRWLTSTLMLALIGCSHIQGLGIAALGVAAIIIWRLIEWRRSMVFWILAALLLLSAAAVVWWPRHWMIDSTYRQFGWMNAWYGFDILSVGSGAFERTTQIFGIAGLVNMFAGLLLLRRNEIAGWLTVTPVVALLLPIVAIPFANILANDNSIISFHRLLFAVPISLPVLALLQHTSRKWHLRFFWNARAARHSSRECELPRLHSIIIGVFVLLLVVALPSESPSYSRIWHSLTVAPRALDYTQTAIDVLRNNHPNIQDDLLSPRGSSFVLHATGTEHAPFRKRLILAQPLIPPSQTAEELMESISRNVGKRLDFLLHIPSRFDALTPSSQAAQLSNHWLPQEFALEATGSPEFFELARQLSSAGILRSESPQTFRLAPRRADE